jgi:hypothetical protein
MLQVPEPAAVQPESPKLSLQLVNEVLVIVPSTVGLPLAVVLILPLSDSAVHVIETFPSPVATVSTAFVLCREEV